MGDGDGAVRGRSNCARRHRGHRRDIHRRARPRYRAGGTNGRNDRGGSVRAHSHGRAWSAPGGGTAKGRTRRGCLMSVVVSIDVLLARRKMSVAEFADAVGITPANVAVLKNGRAKAIRFTTLESICRVLD